jgi:hypothetical protein
MINSALFVHVLLMVKSTHTFDCQLKGLVATPTLSGVGHDTMGLLTAIRMADILQTELYLHDAFWWADSARHHVQSGNYSFMEEYFPFPYLKNVKHKTDNIRVEQLRSVSKLLASGREYCGCVVLINFGAIHACNEGFCCNVPGMFDRSSASLSSLESKWLDKGSVPKGYPTTRHALLGAVSASSPELVVCWHLRTGDVMVGIDIAAILHLKRTIDLQLSTKIPRHVFVTQNATQAKHHFRTHLSSLADFSFVDTADMSDTVRMLFQADVLVSMGSSGSYIVPALKSHKRLVHFYFPPKETFLDRRTWQHLAADHPSTPRTDQDIATTHPFRGYFIRKGVVPVNHHTGQIFPHYTFKMRTMLRHLDQGQDIPLEVSMLHYEQWRPWVLNVSSGVWYDDGFSQW